MSLAFAPPPDFDYTQPAPWHQAFEGINPKAAGQELRALIEHSILNQPRSRQKTIGPSEIGTDCDHCLAAKLAGWQSTEQGVPWLPFVGTAVHAALEEMVIQYEANRNAANTTGRRYLTEARTMVGVIDGTEIWGSTDLVDLAAGVTFDYKIVGVTTLRSAKAGPSNVYRVQQHLYAKGWNDAGHRIDHVAIAYLPRNSVVLSDAVWWNEPYDRDIAQTALDRANGFAVNVRALRSISEAAADDYIRALPRAKNCRDCARFPDAPPAPADPFLDGLDRV
ncbi:MAG: hypothetical protein IIZ13_08125 [Renibacterium sp.]|nr:hypothetical protein [Renibacterium sp.]